MKVAKKEKEQKLKNQQIAKNRRKKKKDYVELLTSKIDEIERDKKYLEHHIKLAKNNRNSSAKLMTMISRLKKKSEEKKNEENLKEKNVKEEVEVTSLMFPDRNKFIQAVFKTWIMEKKIPFFEYFGHISKKSKDFFADDLEDTEQFSEVFKELELDMGLDQDKIKRVGDFKGIFELLNAKFKR